MLGGPGGGSTNHSQNGHQGVVTMNQVNNHNGQSQSNSHLSHNQVGHNSLSNHSSHGGASNFLGGHLQDSDSSLSIVSMVSKFNNMNQSNSGTDMSNRNTGPGSGGCYSNTNVNNNQYGLNFKPNGSSSTHNGYGPGNASHNNAQQQNQSGYGGYSGGKMGGNNFKGMHGQGKKGNFQTENNNYSNMQQNHNSQNSNRGLSNNFPNTLSSNNNSSSNTTTTLQGSSLSGTVNIAVQNALQLQQGYATNNAYNVNVNAKGVNQVKTQRGKSHHTVTNNGTSVTKGGNLSNLMSNAGYGNNVNNNQSHSINGNGKNQNNSRRHQSSQGQGGKNGKYNNNTNNRNSNNLNSLSNQRNGYNNNNYSNQPQSLLKQELAQAQQQYNQNHNLSLQNSNAIGPLNSNNNNSNLQQDTAHSQQAANLPSDVVITQYRKTQLCQYWLKGVCKNGSKCGFAHGHTELRDRPDLSKTSWCPELLARGYCSLAGCPTAGGVNSANLPVKGGPAKISNMNTASSKSTSGSATVSDGTDVTSSAANSNTVNSVTDHSPSNGTSGSGASLEAELNLECFPVGPSAEILKMGYFPERCRFCHTQEEFRDTIGYSSSKKCKFFSLGLCQHGDRCRFVHSAKEGVSGAFGPGGMSNLLASLSSQEILKLQGPCPI